ncbi:type 1 glutamine amidotransferase domain-containing protein [Novosphingopyxis sp.]|uniref:type 1 glutamine amidotransferase domain-containing protein n=1 Tax=Novosphingopyxis sp. TaxID=2709690 RepID=UPI003B5B8B78
MAIEQDLTGLNILIIATDGFEQSELIEPRDQLLGAGATVHVASLQEGEIKGWDEDDWGDSVEVDKIVADVSVDDYDALVLPGGQINPDLLRVEDSVLDLIREFDSSGKIVAAICHAPWLLIEAEIVNGRKATSYKSIRTDLANAGAEVVDESVAVDDNLITSRNPDDLDDFCAAIAEAVLEGVDA